MIDQERNTEIGVGLFVLSVALSLIIIVVSYQFYSTAAFIRNSIVCGVVVGGGYFLQTYTGIPIKLFKLMLGDDISRLNWFFAFTKRFAPKKVTLVNEVSILKDVVQSMSEEQQSLQQELTQARNEQQAIRKQLMAYDDKLAATVTQKMEGYERRFKNGLLNEILGASKDTIGYAKSDAYERARFENEQERRKREAEDREFRLDVKEELQGNRGTIQGLQTEVRQGFAEQEMKLVKLNADFAEKLAAISQTVSSVKEYLVEKITRIDMRITTELSGIREIVSRLRVELKQDVTDLRVHTNSEIVRIDQQQIKIIGKLEEYETKTRAFIQDVARLKNEAHAFALNGKEMLSRADILYRNHRTDIQLLSRDVQDGLQLISLHKRDFANTVGKSKIILDKITQDQYLTLKDIGHERMGVEILRQDYSSRVEKETLKLQQIKSDIQHTEQLITERERNNQQVSGLQHQLFMNRENLAYTQQRLGLLREENSLIRRFY